jgi:hypothetical protein
MLAFFFVYQLADDVELPAIVCAACAEQRIVLEGEPIVAFGQHKGRRESCDDCGCWILAGV